MPQLNSYELNGVKDSFADYITNIAPQDYPFQSMIGKVGTQNAKFSWQTDSDAPVDPNNALMEGFEYSDLDDTFAPTTQIDGYTQKMGKAVKVTGDADAQAAWGRGLESEYQTDKKANELKRDIEFAMLNNGKSVPEVKGVSPRKMGGFKSMISSVDGGTTVVGDPLTGTVTLIEAAGAKPTLDEIFAGMKALWTTGGKPEVLMCSETMSDVISGAMETGTRLRLFEGDNSTKITLEVQTITDALGQTVRVVYNRNMPANTVYLFNSKDWESPLFRAPDTDVEGKSGDYKKLVMHVDLGLRHRNPWASAAIVPFAAL